LCSAAGNETGWQMSLAKLAALVEQRSLESGPIFQHLTIRAWLRDDFIKFS
jgi:hypothetical protein